MAKSSTPPKDTNGELDTAHTLLKRWRKQLVELPLAWRHWLVDSLKDGLEVLPEDDDAK